MRCPDCNKFVGFDTDVEPEVEEPTVDDGNVTVDVRIVNNCAECGAELKQASFSLEGAFELPPGYLNENGEPSEKTEGESFEGEVTTAERTERSEGKGRGVRTFYGVHLVVTVTHVAFPEWSAEVELAEEEQASAMEELV